MSRFSSHGRGRARTLRSLSQRFTQHSALPSDRDILEGLSTTPLQTIVKPSSGCSEEVKITDLQYVGSYNWLDEFSPTIIVPVDEVGKVDGPEFDWAAIDFVTDRNNLRKLLRWVGNNADKDFRVDMQLAGKTILLNRWENRYREQMPGMTFGFNFEKVSTRAAPGCESSTGHHRIVRRTTSSRSTSVAGS
ncbi:hypothetical protein DXG03_002821 [Asterophora parasitica]|uniref:Uncharacterized protein n=1 Tax=Asterophora parasitica TaxID=117018 RepID=A0A9P7KAT1_9AGAR|nr:hypothetical protein DXG03_002821 [Asterophora parasitica]